MTQGADKPGANALAPVPAPIPAERNDLYFWNTLGRNNIPNGFGYVAFYTDISKMLGTWHAIDMYVRAVDAGNGWNLHGKTEPNGGKRVYFLAWRPKQVTWARRDAYEGIGSPYNYFMTAQLSGCRFVLTEDHVLHIAADASPYHSRGGSEHFNRNGAEAEALHSANSTGFSDSGLMAQALSLKLNAEIEALDAEEPQLQEARAQFESAKTHALGPAPVAAPQAAVIIRRYSVSLPTRPEDRRYAPTELTYIIGVRQADNIWKYYSVIGAVWTQME